MPRYDFECDAPACGQIFEGFVALADYPRNEPCVKCGHTTHKIQLPPSVTTHVDPVVVYRAPDGTFRFPGAIDGASTGKYESMGYQRVEAKGWAEVRKLEGQLNKHERSHLARQEERRLAHAEHVESQRRSEIRRQLDQGFRVPETKLVEGRNGEMVVERTGRFITTKLSERGREQMRAAMRHSDDKGHRRIGEPGMHIEAYSTDRSNREASHDERGMRRRD